MLGLTITFALLACGDEPLSTRVAPIPQRPTVQEHPAPERAATTPEPAPTAPEPIARLGANILRHPGIVEVLAATPDGRYFASAGFRSIRVWSSEDGRLVTELRTKGTDALAFAPDAKTLVSADGDGYAHVWRVADGHELATLALFGDGTGAEPGKHVATALAISADASRLVAGDLAGMLAVWDLHTRERLALFDGGRGYVDTLALTPDGRRFACSSGLEDNDDDAEVSIYEIDGEAAPATPDIPPQPSRVLRPRLGIVVALAFTPDAERLVIGSQERGVQVWSLASGKRVATLTRSRKHANAVALSPDGKSVVVALGDARTVERYTLTGKLRRSYGGAADELLGLVFAGELLVGVGLDARVHVWHVDTGAPVFPDAEGGGPVLDLAWSADMSTIATVTPDHRIRLWSGERYTLERTIDGPPGYVHAVDISPDASLVAVTGEDAVAVFDARSGELRVRVGEGERSFDVAIAPDGERLVTTTFGHFSVWSVEDGQRLRVQGKFGRGRVTQVRFAPDGDTFAVAFNNGVAWGVGAEGRPHHVNIGDRLEALRELERLAYDGRRVALDTGVVYELATGELVSEFSPPVPLAFTPTGGLLATGRRGAYEHALVLIDTNTGTIIRSYEGHDGPITAATASADGTRFASASRDTTVLIWAAPRPG